MSILYTYPYSFHEQKSKSPSYDITKQRIIGKTFQKRFNLSILTNSNQQTINDNQLVFTGNVITIKIV
jgi:hypothetical protein